MKAHLVTWLTLSLLKKRFQEKKPLLEVFICSSPSQGNQGWLKLTHDLKAVWTCASNPLLLWVLEQLVPSLVVTAWVGGSPVTRGDTMRAMETWPESSFSSQLQHTQQQSWTCFTLCCWSWWASSRLFCLLSGHLYLVTLCRSSPTQESN